MIKVVSVVGARPNFTKAAPVSRAFQAAGIQEVIVHTGQHYDDNMSSVFFSELEIPAPHRNLGVGSGTHGGQTGSMLEALERVLLDERPDWTLVYGDTNSTLAAALASVKLQIPVLHVEAGLRTFDLRAPEEVNRVLTDRISRLLFVPTQVGMDNLRREGFPDDRLVFSGDVMYDAAIYYGEKAMRVSKICDREGLREGRFVLATVHRAENTDRLERLDTILSALRAIASELPVVLPLHPRTKAVLSAAGTYHQWIEGLHVIPPVGYLDMLRLERAAAVVVTDSGGVQKEAFFQGRPCVVLLEQTPWPELVEAGWNVLCPPESSDVVARAVMSSLGREGKAVAPYGGGDASSTIARTIIETVPEL